MLKDLIILVIKCIAAILLAISLPIMLLILSIIFASMGLWNGFGLLATIIVTTTILGLLFVYRKKLVLICFGIATGLFLVALFINIGLVSYDKSITVDTAPNIDVSLYLPYEQNSRIVRLESEASLRLTENLPVLDGAAAVFPVYSAFVGAVYPNYIRLNDGTFEYNNTRFGYENLANKKTDIFFGAYPSLEQIQYANQQGTYFVYTPIANEAFVFIVHKDNPVSNLTSDQLRGIYSGKITNWKELGGKDEPIVAYQRNEGSGSQSRLIRFMQGTPLMIPPTEQVNNLMSGLIDQVADYRSKSGSIGFSFRYYVEGIIQNPDIKMLSIDGVAPTIENIKNGTYPLVEPLYAVTRFANGNKNVDLLLEWILSDEGQYIIEKTGYAGYTVQN